MAHNDLVIIFANSLRLGQQPAVFQIWGSSLNCSFCHWVCQILCATTTSYFARKWGSWWVAVVSVSGVANFNGEPTWNPIPVATHSLFDFWLSSAPASPVTAIHREDSPVTQTTPEPTLSSWGCWPCEKFPPPPTPGHTASPVLSR